MLVLAIAYNHYAYLASAVAIAIAASALADLRSHRRERSSRSSPRSSSLHGVIVMARMHAVGAIQRNLYADLLAELQLDRAAAHHVAADPRDAWLPGRLLRGVDRYRGVRIRRPRALRRRHARAARRPSTIR